MKPAFHVLSRRAVLAGSGALIVSFSIARLSAQEAPHEKEPAPPKPPEPKLPGDLKVAPYLDAWIKIEPDNTITVFTGKAELGQGMKTAMLQVAAEELDVPPGALKLVTADTSRTANEGYTAGSQSMPEGATAIRNAAAQVREILIAEAAKRTNSDASQFSTTGNGSVAAAGGQHFTYGELVSGALLHVEAQPQSRLRDASQFKVIGKPVPRIDIPAKVTGGEAYVHDMRPAGLLHGRVVRQPSYGAKLTSVEADKVEKMPGVVKVVRDGSFLGVVAEREFQAVRALARLAAAASWEETSSLPDERKLHEAIQALDSQDHVILDRKDASPPVVKTLEAGYTKPYLAHGSIGPSCAIAQLDGDNLTIWSHTQGVFPDRKAIAEMMRMPPDRVRIIHAEGAGCYGHNGADDAAADAALLARAVAGRPVRVQWMREQEHSWEPFGPAMVTKVRASLDASGRIAAWEYELWSNSHSTRPGTAGSLIAGRALAEPFAQPEPERIPLPAGGGDRNAIPIYNIPAARVTHHFLRAMRVRVSALRGLGAYMNVFSIESFMDELAEAAGADPVAFRLKHLDDPRAKDVINLTAERFGWTGQAPPSHAFGFAFARYKNFASYCAVAVEVAVARETGRVRIIRAASAIDAGQIVNPDGLVNQTEGGIIQAASWTLFERVSFDNTRITSIDWSAYPILRFDGVPEIVEVHLIDRPNAPFLGAGEAAQGPTAAAIANAVSRAAGKRIRDLPLTHDRVRAAIMA